MKHSLCLKESVNWDYEATETFEGIEAKFLLL